MSRLASALRLGGLLLGLASPAPAWALDWWVPDEAEAQALRAALSRLWPDGAVEVRLGPWPGQGVGVRDGRLLLVAEGTSRAAPDPADAATEVVLVRAWTAAVGVRRPPRAPGPVLCLAAGPGLAPEPSIAPLHVVGGAELGWRSLTGEIGLVYDGGAVLDSEAAAAVRHTRAGGVARVGLQAPLWGGTFRATLGPSLRTVWSRTAPRGELPAGPPVGGWTWGVHEHLTWRAVARPHLELGVGLSVAVDDPVAALSARLLPLPDGDAVEVPSYLAALEFGAAWRPGRGR